MILSIALNGCFTKSYQFVFVQVNNYSIIKLVKRVYMIIIPD